MRKELLAAGGSLVVAGCNVPGFARVDLPEFELNIAPIVRQFADKDGVCELPQRPVTAVSGTTTSEDSLPNAGEFVFPPEITGRERVVVCFPNPTGEQAIARPTPTPTPEPTPTATAKPEKQTTSNLLEGEHPKTKQTKPGSITTSIKKIWKNNPDAEDILPLDLALDNWKDCQKDNKRTSHKYLNLMTGCQGTIYVLDEIRNKTGDERIYNTERAIYDFAYNVLPEQYLKQLNENLERPI